MKEMCLDIVESIRRRIMPALPACAASARETAAPPEGEERPRNGSATQADRPHGRAAKLAAANEHLRRELGKRDHALSLLSAALEATTDGILVRDITGKTITFNRKFAEMWRFPEAVLATRDDKRMRSFVLDQLKEPQKFLEITERELSHPEIEGDDILEFKDGRIFERFSKPHIIGDKTVGLVLSFRDITGQKKAEVELGKVNRALRTFSDCNNALVYATDERSLLIEICRSIVTSGGYRFTWVGYPMDDEAKTVRPVAHAGHEDGYLDAVRVTWADSEAGRGPVGTAIRSGTPCIIRDINDANFALWHEEARKRGYRSVVGLPLTASGETFGMLAIYAAEPDAFDTEEVNLLHKLAANLAYGITALRTREERKRTEEGLRESEERFRSIFVDGPLGMGITDLDSRFVKVNETFCRMMGYSEEEFTALTIADITHPDDADATAQNQRRIFRSGSRFYKAEKRYVKKSGDVIWVHVTVMMIRDDSGKPLYLLGMIEDITERRNLENQLRHSQKMEAIGTLAGGIAHDFNNILTAMIGYCTLIERKTGVNDPVRHYLHKLFASTERATALTKGLLAYSRKQPFNPQPVDLNVVVRKVEHLLARLLGEDIELAISPAAGSLTIMADTLQIEQVLMNLATNGRDAMPRGGSLRIATAPVDLNSSFMRLHGDGKAGKYALVTVADSGDGMDEQTRERIFEPFFTTKEVGKGTGLGLSIAFGIIKQHGGIIEVGSEPGKGSTFSIFLPLTALKETDCRVADNTIPGTGCETILLVEDDREIRTTLTELLEAHGYSVIVAVDGEDGIRKFNRHRDDIVLLILDMIMPKKNGRQVFEEVQTIRPGTKALFLSGYTADILDAKGISPDDLVIVTKPVEINRLLGKIREVLEK